MEHLLGILSALLQSLPAESTGRIRTLAKFVENEYEKTRRITELRREYASKLNKVDEDIRGQRARMNGDVNDEMETDWLSKRLEAGLFSVQVCIVRSRRYEPKLLTPLQTIDLILAFLAAEDDGTRSIITSLLAEQGESLATVKSTLQGTHTTLPWRPNFADAASRPNSVHRERRRRIKRSQGDD